MKNSSSMLVLSESPSILEEAEEQILGAFQEMFYIREAAKTLLVGMAAELSTKIGPEQLSTALRQLQQSQPVLRAQVKKQPAERPVLFLHPNIKEIPIATRSLSGATLNDLMGEALIAPFVDPNEPLLRAVLVEVEARSAIILVVHHLLLDGAGLLHILARLVKILSGAASFDSSRKLLLPSIEQKLGIPVQPYENVARCALLPVDPAIYTPEHVRHTRQCAVEDRLLSPEETSALRRRAKEEETTVQGALAAAVLLTARRMMQEAVERPLSCLAPIDLRSHLGLDAGEPGVFIGAYMHLFPSGQVPAFWELARSHRQGIIASSEGAAILKAAGGMTAMLCDEVGVDDLDDFVNRIGFDLMVSNLGVIPPSLFDNCSILEDLWFYTSASGLRTQTITILTWHNSLHIMHSSPTPVPHMLENIYRELLNALQ
jgi:hypothetical protein